MPIFGISILILSTFTHAAWNIIGKKSPSKEFFFIANTCGFLLLSPIIFVHIPQFHFNLYIWLLILLASLFDAIYFISLGKGYKIGDISIIYPITRSLPTLLVISYSVILNYKQPLNLDFLLGGLMIITSCLILSTKNSSKFSIYKYFQPSCIFAYIAAFASAGYLITDNFALHTFKNNSNHDLIKIAVIYSFVRGITISIWLGVLILYDKEKDFSSILQKDLKQPIYMGIGIYLTYTLVLISMNFINNVSYVATIRQFSIIITALYAHYILKEKMSFLRVTGILIMILGVFFVVKSCHQ